MRNNLPVLAIVVLLALSGIHSHAGDLLPVHLKSAVDETMVKEKMRVKQQKTWKEWICEHKVGVGVTAAVLGGTIMAGGAVVYMVDQALRDLSEKIISDVFNQIKIGN